MSHNLADSDGSIFDAKPGSLFGAKQQKIFHAKLAGHIRYYGVSFNAKQLERFVYQATRILFKWLNRRSQRKSFTWDQFGCFLQAFPLPQVRIYHRLYGPTAV